jgi:hypothetical protein
MVVMVRFGSGKYLFLVIFFSRLAMSQTVQDHNLNAWFMYFGDHPVSEKWGLHLEAQIRRAEAGLTWQQLLLRPGVNYQLNQNILFTAGYGYVRSTPYGDFRSTASVPEHRFFEQVLLKHRLGKVAFQHRLRQEQRYIGVVPARNADVEGWETRNRFRYMLRGDIPLPIGAAKRFGLALYDEFFVQFGANRGLRYLDQNRAYGALAYKLSKSNRLEVGYLHQYIPQRNGIVVEHNHTLQLALYSVAPIRWGRRTGAD